MIRKIRNSRRYYLSESVTVSEFRDNQTRPPVSSSLLLTNVTSRGIVVVENINLIEEAGMYEEYSAPAFYSLSFLPPPFTPPNPHHAPSFYTHSAKDEFEKCAIFSATVCCDPRPVGRAVGGVWCQDGGSVTRLTDAVGPHGNSGHTLAAKFYKVRRRRARPTSLSRNRTLERIKPKAKPGDRKANLARIRE